MQYRLWKGKRKILRCNNPHVGPRLNLPRWWVAEDENEVYMEVYPNFILIYRLSFDRANEVLKKLREGGRNARGAPLQKG